MAIEKFQRSNEILLGGTFMRQNNVIFDLQNNQLGFARAKCNSDPFQVRDKEELQLAQLYVDKLDSALE